MPLFNPELMKLALYKLEQQQKEAFVPSDMAAGGQPGGGAPPGMDPAAMGGAPPPGGDPAAGGAPPPPGGDPAAAGAGGGMQDVQMMIQQAVQQAVQQAMGGMGGGMAGGMGAGGPMGAMGKPAKPDINTVAMDIFQVKKLLTNIYQINNWALPPDIIDGPNRDPASGAAMPPGAPGSTSDPNAQAQAAPPGGAGGGDPSQSAIPPIEPMPGASPAGGGGMGGAEKMSSQQNGVEVVGYEHDTGIANTVTKAAAVSALLKSLRSKKQERVPA